MNENLILCLTKRFGDFNPSSILEGSVVKKCSSCMSEVYVSKSGAEFIDKATPEDMPDIICTNCFKSSAEQLKEHKVEIVPGAIQEIQDNL